MESRHEALEAFYDGPVWAAHRTEANNTMEDSDDVLLLKPARPELAFRIGSGTGTPSSDGEPSTVLAGIYQMPRPVDAWLVSQFERQVAPILQANGVQIVAVLMAESARNTFTRLPVRQGEHVLVWLGILQDPDRSPPGIDRLTRTIALDNRPVSLLELEPTSRSRAWAAVRRPHARRSMTSISCSGRGTFTTGISRVGCVTRPSGWSSTRGRTPSRCWTVLAILIVIRPCATDHRSRASRCGCSIRRQVNGRSTGPIPRAREPCCRR